MSEAQAVPLKGPRALIGWFLYYCELGRMTSGGPFWAITKLASNRSTYGNWAPPEYQP
jgi:hypothetical protein